jgi:hypothetical protein
VCWCTLWPLAFVPVGPEYVFSFFPSTTADLFFFPFFRFLSLFSVASFQRTRRVQKFTRAVSGMDIAALRKKQNEKKSKRASQQKLQLQEIKDRKRKAKAERKKSGGGSKSKAIQGGRGKN